MFNKVRPRVFNRWWWGFGGEAPEKKLDSKIIDLGPASVRDRRKIDAVFCDNRKQLSVATALRRRFHYNHSLYIAPY